ncbi:MAG: family phage major capsid protein [Herbaspirillum sp.]|nr:family phage major capsid protein [Herbaspirillum sp.]
MKSVKIIFALVAILAFGIAYAVEPASATHFLHQFAMAGGAGASLMFVGDTTGDVLKAIEASNKAFEEFKKTNDARIEKMEKGQHVPDDMQAKMNAVFKDMSDQKAIIETLEAKLKRPLLGGDGKPVDEQAEEHKKAFSGYLRKGIEYSKDIEQKALNIGAGADGGFAVPKVIDGMIDELAVNISPIRSIAQVQQISTSDFHKLINVRGTSSGWVGETAARPATNTPQLVDIAPPMGELYANPQATQQMLDDVFFNAEQWLAGEIATEFARAEGAAHCAGTGVNQPKGIFSYASAATADATRTFGTIEHVATGVSGGFKVLTSTVNPVDDLFSLVSKMKALYRPGSRWLTNKAVLFTIMAMKDYQGRYVFSPTTAPGMADTVLGYPVTEAEDVPALAASSLSLAFGNFKLAYLIVDRIGTRVIRDPFSNKPNIGFYTTKRTGGSLLNSEAVKVIKFI